MMQVERTERLSRYKHVGIAIGLLELLGNSKPDTRQVALAEKIVKCLNLDWEDCLDEPGFISFMIHEIKNR